MGMRMLETCWAVFEWQVINLRIYYIWLVDSVESMMMHGPANTKCNKHVCLLILFIKRCNFFFRDVCVTWIYMWHPCLSRRYNDLTFRIILCWSSLLICSESVCLRVQSDLSLCGVHEMLLSSFNSTFSPKAVAFQRRIHMTEPKTGRTYTHTQKK
jgi:hypothetical protein